MELNKIKEMIELMKVNDLKVFHFKEEKTELYLEAHDKQTKSHQTLNAEKDVTPSADKNTQSTTTEIRAKQIGVFYTQPDEDSTDTFVQVGDRVEIGDQIGLIEMMKLFNEVRVEQAGVIEEILVKNGETVEYDQVLMRLRPEGE